MDNELNEPSSEGFVEIEGDTSNSGGEAIVLREISGKRSYKTGEVAKMLGETTAMIGFYCREFAEHLNMPHSAGQHRNFNEENIKVLEYIIYLMKDERMTAEQAKQFLSTPQGKLLAPINNEEDKVKVFVELITKELKCSLEGIVKSQVENSLRSIMPELVNQSMTSMSNHLLEQQSKMEDTIKELVNEGVNSLNKVGELVEANQENIGQLTSTLTEAEKRLVDIKEDLLQRHEAQKKKGIFSKFFNKG